MSGCVGPRTKSTPRFGIHESRAAAYDGRFFMSVFREHRLVSNNGTEWSWVSQPIHSTVMEAHDGLLYTSSFSSDEEGADEGPINVFDGTPTRGLVDPPDMAWTWFVSHNDELWMTGFRDEGTFGPIVEAGVYRWDDSVQGRVSTAGSALDGASMGELLVRQATERLCTL